jgi:hypothetical protein
MNGIMHCVVNFYETTWCNIPEGLLSSKSDSNSDRDEDTSNKIAEDFKYSTTNNISEEDEINHPCSIANSERMNEGMWWVRPNIQKLSVWKESNCCSKEPLFG